MAKRIFLYFALVVGSLACTEYGRVSRNGTVEEKYMAAIRFYQEKEYYKCTTLLDGILPFISGGEEFVDAMFIFAESYFYQNDFYMAEYYYKKFVAKFPRSEKAQQAEYMIAKSQYMQSPKVSLDQTQTINALNTLQAYLNRYPTSGNAAECSALIEEMHKKLEDKAYRTAKLHLKIKNYKAAVTSFEIFARDYPSSEYNEELAFLKIFAQVELAKISLEKIKENGTIIQLRRDRFKKAIEYYFDFTDSYKESKYAKEAENYYKTAVNNTTIK